jgi:ADP-ribose pyrophosphatase YjhB (NUDIX family)
VSRPAEGQSQAREEYLLVQAKNAPHEWVLPKGHIEAGEKLAEAAVREVREETGAWARVMGDLGDTSFSVKGERVKVRFFLMELLEQGAPSDDGRKHAWQTLDEALQQLAHQESRDLLKLSQEKLKTL